MAHNHSGPPSSRLSLHHLLRDPGTTLTLAPAYHDRASPLEQRSSPGVGLGSSSPLAKAALSGNAYGYTNDEDDVSGDAKSTIGRRQGPKKEVKPQIPSAPSTARGKRPRKSAPTGSTSKGSNGKMPFRQSTDATWGFPPPEPTFQGFNHGESSTMAARRGVSPGGMSSFSGLGQSDMGTVKRRRESEQDWGSMEPEDETGPR